MKNKMRKMMAMLSAAVVAVGVMGCGGNAATDSNADANTTSQTADATTDTTASADLSGKITLAGSTSMEKLANAMAEAFMEKYPNVTVAPEFTGSGAGLESLAKGTVDIGDASRALSDDEKAGGAVENIVAIDGIAVITDSENAVSDITSEQLAQIYTGEITNWSDLGGADEQIVVIGREAGSGTRDGFESITETKDTCVYRQELTSTGDVITTVANNPDAIGYASLASLKDTVKAVTVDGVAPSEDTVKDGSYKIQRPFVLVTKEGVELSETAQSFMDYATSADSADIIRQAGAVAAN